VRFTRRDIRGYSNWSDSQLKNHCMRLQEMEYLLLHGGSRGHLLHYELLWDGSGKGDAHLCGLLEVDEAVGDGRKSDSDESKSASGPGQVCPMSDPEKCLRPDRARG
jgi:hypothetical protein